MNLNKVIFLDIDGVLALNGFNLPKTKWLWNKAYPFDKPCVEILNEILRKTNAEIVLSSQWRTYYTDDELDKIFDWKGIVKKPIAKTESIDGFTRCMQIESFMEENEVAKFVIIDDMKMDCYQNRFIHTTARKGLNEEHILKIVSILNK